MLAQFEIDSKLVFELGEKSFMVQEGMVLGQTVSCKGIEVDKAKIEIIEKLPPSSSDKSIRSFLDHAGFY